MSTRFVCIGLTILIGVTLALIVWDLLIRRPSLKVEHARPSPSPILSDIYVGIRSQALNFAPEQFDITTIPDEAKVYGVIMDWHVGRGVISIASFINGDTSMYTSSGGGIIGGAGHERVRRASIQFVEKAQRYLDVTKPSNDLTLPPGGHVKFFLLTTKGRLTAEEDLVNFDNGSSPLLGLFEDGNEVIRELREIPEDVR